MQSLPQIPKREPIPASDIAKQLAELLVLRDLVRRAEGRITKVDFAVEPTVIAGSPPST
jgi:hypothetical protein